MRPKKSLGQHFLNSEGALNSMANSGDIKATDTILEIGPGKGALTKKLLLSAKKVIAVEKDDNLYENLKEIFKKDIEKGKLELVHEDILDFDLSKLKTKTYKLIANIPYNITGAILRKFFSSANQPSRIVLLLQKEVAERVVARNGKESILSISVKAYGNPKYVERVLAGSFFPAPNVDSAIMLVSDITKEFFNRFDEPQFFALLKSGFASKRKKLSSNLSGLIPKERVTKTFSELNIDPNTRAEDVSVEKWGEIASKLL
jgi:16S rRNA (adenine1518-N6/adenine1519-N6)-dimethyltransferase